MLKLDDRLQVALGAGMGVQLTLGDVERVAMWLVALRQIADGEARGQERGLAADALGELRSEHRDATGLVRRRR